MLTVLSCYPIYLLFSYKKQNLNTLLIFKVLVILCTYYYILKVLISI